LLRHEHSIIKCVERSTIKLSQGLEVRWEQNFNLYINLWVEESMDAVLVLLADQLALVLVLIGFIELPCILKFKYLIDYVLIEIVVKGCVQIFW